MISLEKSLSTISAEELEVELYGREEDYDLLENRDWHILTRILREHGITQEIASKSAEDCSWEELQNRQTAFLKMREINPILADQIMTYGVTQSE